MFSSKTISYCFINNRMSLLFIFTWTEKIRYPYGEGKGGLYLLLQKEAEQGI